MVRFSDTASSGMTVAVTEDVTVEDSMGTLWLVKGYGDGSAASIVMMLLSEELLLESLGELLEMLADDPIDSDVIIGSS